MFICMFLKSKIYGRQLGSPVGNIFWSIPLNFFWAQSLELGISCEILYYNLIPFLHWEEVPNWPSPEDCWFCPDGNWYPSRVFSLDPTTKMLEICMKDVILPNWALRGKQQKSSNKSQATKAKQQMPSNRCQATNVKDQASSIKHKVLTLKCQYSKCAWLQTLMKFMIFFSYRISIFFSVKFWAWGLWYVYLCICACLSII